eukprot:709574-Pyramimonas_sp.AAC.1
MQRWSLGKPRGPGAAFLGTPLAHVQPRHPGSLALPPPSLLPQPLPHPPSPPLLPIPPPLLPPPPLFCLWYVFP